MYAYIHITPWYGPVVFKLCSTAPWGSEKLVNIICIILSDSFIFLSIFVHNWRWVYF